VRNALRGASWRARAAHDRLHLRALQWWHPGLEVAPDVTPAFAVARYNLGPGARLRIASGAATERLPGALSFVIHSGGEVVVDEGAWLRTEIEPICLVAYPGARLHIGPETLLNGCKLSAKAEVVIGRRSMVGPGSRVYDADQHPFDAERPEQIAPVRIGEYVWVASDVTVMRGVTIGDHAVVGARSVVLRDVPAHTLALGTPAEPRGAVGDRSSVT
jgi:carbonic anhydrase/acetyltransferase-like protein (isoleucine patch superfamily)